MPLTKSGKEALRNYKKQYGAEKGEDFFYASIQKGNPGTEKWHQGGSKKSKKKR